MKKLLFIFALISVPAFAQTVLIPVFTSARYRVRAAGSDILT